MVDKASVKPEYQLTITEGKTASPSVDTVGRSLSFLSMAFLHGKRV